MSARAPAAAVTASPRLWVTGLGLVTALGVGVEATWARLVRGDGAIRPITRFDAAAQRTGLAAEVDGVEVPGGGWSRTSAMAATAAGEAMRGAGLDVKRARVGLVVAGTTGGMFETEHLLARLHAEPECREVLVAMLSHPLTATGDRLAETLGPFARVRTLSSACSSGSNALVVAAGWLLSGEVDAVVAGGSDGLCRLTVSGFNALGALDAVPCRPFDRRRRGTSLGEGAGFLVLERAASAQARGAKAIAELAGWATGSEAHHITHPAPDGARVASLIEQAMARARLSPREVDYVHAHGTGTPHNDPMEAQALARALGPELARIPVSSSKGQIGHTLGAAGAIEAAVTALVVSRRVLVPTVGLDEPDEALGLVHVAHVGREVGRVRAALSNAFGFGGMDAVLLFREPGLESAPTAAPGLASTAPASVVEAVITGAAVLGPGGLRGMEECAALLDPSHDPPALVDLDTCLDPMRARRFDRAARLGAVVVGRALADSGAEPAATGLVLGSAFGNVDGSAAFMHRIFGKGPRAASPAEFPNLVPSSAVGNVSIYLGLHGPAFAVADLATSGESAFLQALQLISAGEATQVAAGAVEPRSSIVERILGALFALSPSAAGAARSEVAAALVVESAAGARERGARVLARVRQSLEARADSPSWGKLASPRGRRAEVVLAREGEASALLGGSPWRDAPRLVCAASLGESDGLGAVAIAVAAGRLAAGRADESLVLGVSRGRAYAVILERDDPALR